MAQLTSEAMSLQKALNEIHFYRGVVPVEAYKVLTNFQQEATPYLIQELKNVIQRHSRTGNYYVAHIHALLLLSQFEEKKAYPLFIELLNLPIGSIDHLLGDLFTETTPKIITSLYDGNPEPLFAILINRNADDILRLVIGSCFSALLYQKLINREMILVRFQELIASGKMNRDSTFFSALANITVECKLEPLYDIIRAAFKIQMIPNDLMDIQFFEKSLSRPIEKIAREEDLHPLSDAVKELSKWYSDSNPIAISAKIERNTSCPCGSGQKFKKCCIHRL